MIVKLCGKCSKTYDWERNSQECPHNGFPREQKCQSHGRTNCGNHECQNNLVEIRKESAQKTAS